MSFPRPQNSAEKDIPGSVDYFQNQERPAPSPGSTVRALPGSFPASQPNIVPLNPRSQSEAVPAHPPAQDPCQLSNMSEKEPPYIPPVPVHQGPYSSQSPEQQVNQMQPQPTAAMNPYTTGGNRNVKGIPFGQDNKRGWSNGLCNLGSNFGLCCYSWWCPCMIYGQNKQRLEHLERHGTPDPEHGGPPFTVDCCLHAALDYFCLAGWVLQIPERASIRSRYQIRGNSISDCATAFCCLPCLLTQEYREMELEEQSFGPAHA